MNKYCYLLFMLYPLAFLNGQTVMEALSLDSAIVTALKNNPETKASYEKIAAARGRFWSAISPPPAELSATNDYIPAGKRLSNYGEKTVEFNQAFDFPTKYFLRGSKYKNEIEIARQEYGQSTIAVISQVKSAYFKVLALQKQVTIAQENLVIAKDFADKAHLRHSIGEGTNLEKLTAGVQYSEALNSAGMYDNHLASAYAELSFALGFGNKAPKTYKLSDTLGFTRYDLSLSKLATDADRCNPQGAINKLRLKNCTIDRRLAWSDLLPDINIGFFNKQVRDDVARYYGASIGISVPLWFMLDQRGKINETTSSSAATTFDIHMAGNALFLKTQQALNEVQNEEQQVLLYQNDILPQAEEIYRTASKSYEAGEITYVEFLQAQQTLMTSRSNYCNALLSYNLSTVSLEEVIGKSLTQKGDK